MYLNLDDLGKGGGSRQFINGNQALIKALLIRKSFDKNHGLRTKGYVSGYRGSPLAGLDIELSKAKDLLGAQGIIFEPLINEDLAATAIWGTQQIDVYESNGIDGVFSLWYAKGAGIDRSGDAIRHANSAGTHCCGGVLLVYGDDHGVKSSSVAHQSEQLLSALAVPSLYPSTVQEIIEYSLIGWDMSRKTGLWIGLKCVSEVVERSASIDSVDIEDSVFDKNDRLNIKPNGFSPKNSEKILFESRLPAVYEYLSQVKINKVVYGVKQPKFAIVTSGKSALDTLESLDFLKDLMLEKDIGVLKIACIWPLEPAVVKNFCSKAEVVICIEDKHEILEGQLKSILFNQKLKCIVVGKFDEFGRELFSSVDQINVNDISSVILRYINKGASCGWIEQLSNTKGRSLKLRTPFFCAGCPHSSSTRIPEGSIGLSGIGCHIMVLFNESDRYLPSTQMGGEGACWLGARHFTETQHVFQNLGDGTYFHSGILSIRAAIAVKANITFKILYNSVVAMTGGQNIDGALDVFTIYNQVKAEGVAECIIITDDKSKYNGSSFEVLKDLRDRNDLDYEQERLRTQLGVSVIIYDQSCAIERKRKSNSKDSKRKTYIYSPVCEGCGDCSKKMPCVAIQPKKTKFGLKREINQSSCNYDYGCIKGYCPSFISIKNYSSINVKDKYDQLFSDLPDVSSNFGIDNSYSALFLGIGGTGVSTVAKIFSKAAHLEGRASSLYSVNGLSQKNGTVISHVCLGKKAGYSAKISPNQADLIFSSDVLSVMSSEVLECINSDFTKLLVNSDFTPSSDFQFSSNDYAVDYDSLIGEVSSFFKREHISSLGSNSISKLVFNDEIFSNLILFGYAYQSGFIPIKLSSIVDSIYSFSFDAENFLRAFNIGRLAFYKPNTFDRKSQSLILTSSEMTDYLTQYQSVSWAARFESSINSFKNSLDMWSFSSEESSDIVATIERNLFNLMSYKDVYEICRLFSHQDFLDDLRSEFGNNVRFDFNLSFPFFGKWLKGEKVRCDQKVMILFSVFKRLKFLRGSLFDVFGYSSLRKKERFLISEYTSFVSDVLGDVDCLVYDDLILLVDLPNTIRGYGYIKEKSIDDFFVTWNEFKSVRRWA